MHPRASVPDRLLRTARQQDGLLSARQVLHAGLDRGDVRGLLSRGEWIRAARGVYEVRELTPTTWDARRRRAALVALLTYGPHAISVGACALALHGVAGLPSHLAPEVALSRGSRRVDRDGVRVRQFDRGMRTVDVAGRRVAALEWAVAQAVPELPRPNALAVLDDLLRTGRLDRHGLEIAHDLARGRRGIASRHELWKHADARAESPLESFARLECIDEGVPPDVLQLPFRNSAGRVVARGDMGWRRRDGRWLVAELDGHDVHSTPDAVFADRGRQNLMTGSGLVDLLRFTSRDRGRIATTVRRHLVG